MTKHENIVSYSLDEIREMLARGEDRTDWAKVDATTQEELERRIAGNPDDHHGPIGEHIPDWRAYLAERELAEAATVTVGGDVVAWLRRHDGRDLETVVNDLLRQHIESAEVSEPAE